ncbi:FMN-dependent NADH-azoreductase [Rhizobium leguminosarum]|uniref:FMN-dependent NADH-azoreductase n=1 Tax=Rhizobium leguminosarum TaxID=384 RepID=UPI0014422C7F|nr:NAD(P)H-dependent oxidoreductase [Rhizobium leguminosarum]NKN03059.1 FMN-dependent NADH-azoreductase [Rhizobium leguminosarum bv. viciae]
MKLFHLDSSIQGGKSASRAISAAEVEQLSSGNTELEIVYRDLVAAPLAHLTLEAFAGAKAKAVLTEFQSADIVVIGAPLYNFTISSQLKAWFDRILVAGETLSYSESGQEGLAGDKRIIVAVARGGVYAEGSPFASFEHAETLLKSLLSFIGISGPEFIVAEELATGEQARQASIDAALGQAQLLRLAA